MKEEERRVEEEEMARLRVFTSNIDERLARAKAEQQRRDALVPELRIDWPWIYSGESGRTGIMRICVWSWQSNRNWRNCG
jgi:hypothetical protein